MDGPDVVTNPEDINDVTPPTDPPPAVDPPPVVNAPPTDTPPTDNKEWYMREGVKGEGEKPEWFKSDKYGSVEDQAKACKDLEVKFGAFTGAPKDGYLTDDINEKLKENGYEVDNDDPLLNEYKDFAKDVGMNQEGFERGMEMYAMSKQADELAIEVFKESEIKSLGDNAEKMIGDMNDWGDANLPEALREGFKQAFPTADSLKAGMAIIAMTQGTPANPEHADPAGPITSAELTAMQFELDGNGNRKINSDPAFRAKYESAKKQVHGDENDITYVG